MRFNMNTGGLVKVVLELVVSTKSLKNWELNSAVLPTQKDFSKNVYI